MNRPQGAAQMRLVQEPKIRKIIMAYIKRFTNSLKEKITEEMLRDEIVIEFKAAKTGSSNNIETPNNMFVIRPICDSKVKLFTMASVI